MSNGKIKDTGEEAAPREILIEAPGLKIKGVLNKTLTARKVWEALPFEGAANVWGEEVYFIIPVAAELENGREVVQLGDIGYWPPGKAFCFFFGPTPVSRGNEIRPYSPVTVVGKIAGDPGELKKVKEGERVRIIRL